MTYPKNRYLALTGAAIALSGALLGLTPAAAHGPETDSPAEKQSYHTPAHIVNTPLNTVGAFEVYVHEFVSWPAPAVLGDGFGPRECPEGCSTYHMGIDILPGSGVPVKSVAQGTVVQAGENSGYGYSVTVEHIIEGNHVLTLYAHMQSDSLQVQPGDTVQRGEMLGRVGNTGMSFGDHLHFEVRLNGSSVDPLTWLESVNAREYPMS